MCCILIRYPKTIPYLRRLPSSLPARNFWSIMVSCSPESSHTRVDHGEIRERSTAAQLIIDELMLIGGITQKF